MHQPHRKMLRTALNRGTPRSLLHRSSRLSSSQYDMSWACEKTIQIPQSSTVLGLCKFRMGHLSESSVLAKAGNTMVHVALNSKSPDEQPKEDFLPLTVDYRSRSYAFGVLPPQSKRRERHGDDEEILVARVIDRAIRPLFPKGYTDEVQLTVTAHAADDVHDPTVLAVNAASAALYNSKQPWHGPIGCVRIGMIDGSLVVDPKLEDMKRSTLDLLYAGTAERTLMIEAGGYEISEAVMAQAMGLAHAQVKTIVDAQIHSLAQGSQATPSSINRAHKPLPYVLTEKDKAYLVNEFVGQAKDVYRGMSGGKDGRGQLEGKCREAVAKILREDSVWASRHTVERSMAVDFVSYMAFREVLLEADSSPDKTAAVEADAAAAAVRRVDGRAVNQLRPISCRADVLPVVHGSAYFTRGDTHLLSTVTLASATETKLSVPVDYKGQQVPENFFLHYDFPPYCTGELGNVTAVNRRMIGHGKLAEKALRYVLPAFSDFPYTVRVFGECTSSNGSSSMAAACAGSVALLDAGVPLKGAVGGVSVGLVTSPDQSRHLLLKDIIGSEDHYGDMDFKVAGTHRGITAIQLDVKLEGGVPLPILVDALNIAKEGRLEILQHLQSAITKDIGLKAHAPRAELIKIDEARVDHLVGPRGDTIKFLQKAFNVDIELREDLSVYVFGQNAAAVKEARGCIEDIAVGLKPGTEVLATVMQVQDFGVIVRINRAGEGYVHISDFTHDQDILKQHVSAVLQPGHRFRAKVMSVDMLSGTVKLSRRQILDSDQRDTLSDLTHYTEAEMKSMILQEVPKFPIKPPRVWSKEYFSTSVATASDITKAMTPTASTGANNTQPSSGKPQRRHHYPHAHAHTQQGGQQQHARNKGGHSQGHQGHHHAAASNSSPAEHRRPKPNHFNTDASRPVKDKAVKTPPNTSNVPATSTAPPPDSST